MKMPLKMIAVILPFSYCRLFIVWLLLVIQIAVDHKRLSENEEKDRSPWHPWGNRRKTRGYTINPIAH